MDISVGSLLFRLVEHVGEATLATVLPVGVGSHEHTGTTLLGRALAPQAVDLAVIVNLVVLQDSELNLAVLVLDLLGGSVILLPLLSSTPKPQHKVKSRLFLNVVVGQSPAIL